MAGVLLAPAAVTSTAPAMSAGAEARAGARPAVTVAVPTFGNGPIAYTCTLAVGGQSGWVTDSHPPSLATFHTWPWGSYLGGVQWSHDGSEMVHQASGSSTYWPPSGTATTVFLSEDTSAYPWWDTNFSNTSGFVDSDETFSAHSYNIYFTRTTTATATSRVNSIQAAGSDPPVELPQPAGNNRRPDASVTGDIVFEHDDATGSSSIYFLASGANTAVSLGAGTALTGAQMPRLSPDGTKIAFLDQGATTLYTMNTDGTGIAQAGPGGLGQAAGDLRWSPDGTKLLYSLGPNVFEVGVTFGSLPTLDNVVGNCRNTGKPTEVSWQPLPTSPDQVIRTSGPNREGTAIAVSHASFPVDHTADAVVLADSLHFPDALSGGPLAVKVHGPLLLTPGTLAGPIPAVTAEMARVLKPAAKQVYVLGGTGSISQGIENALVAAGYTVTRFAGLNREETSLRIAQFLGQGANGPQELLLATGTDFPDGLSAGAAAGSYWIGSNPPGGAVLLTAGATLTPAAQAYIAADIAGHPDPANKVYVTTVGGLADRAYTNPDKISLVGADRYETSELVAEVHFGAVPAVTLASGQYFPDALSGGAFAGSINAPVLLTPASLTTTTAVPYYLHATSGAIATAYVFGGIGMINATQIAQLRSIIGLGTTYTPITPTTSSAALRAAAMTSAKATAKRAPRLTARSFTKQ